MASSTHKTLLLREEFKEDIKEAELDQSSLASMPKSPCHIGRPSSMIIKKVHTVIPAHLLAEAIATLHGLDLRWSGPITPTEMQYVEQYIFTKYPQYFNGLVGEQKLSLENLCIDEESSPAPDEKGKSPRNSPSSGPYDNLDATQLEPSRLLDILTKKTSFQGNFISIPEIQARNRVLSNFGLSEDDYLVLFVPNYRDAMMMIGESYPFFKGNYYMTVIGNEADSIREFAGNKEARVVPVPESWLDLRIKGSQLSQYFRRKCKHIPKGLFSYPINVNGTRYSAHWISEAHRNSWHVLVDATELDFCRERLALALHRPDFVLSTVDNTHSQPSKVICLLVRRRRFDSAPY